MGTYELLRFADPEALARSVAAEWLKHAGRAAADPQPYCVALSGGRIAKQFCAAVAQQAAAQPAGLRQVHFFWGDERCVAPSDPESNFGLARDALLSPLGIAAGHIHRIKGEEPPERAAQLAERELRELVRRERQGQPMFDLVFLGLGEEGHVASLFPGESEELIKSSAVFRPVIATKPPPQRVTLGYPALAAAEQVWVLASGAGKERALADSLTPGGRTPLGRVLTLRSATKIFTDIAV